MQLPLYANNIWLFQKPLDFRCGKNSLISLIMRAHKNPIEGLYLFLNKRRDKIKGLCWHKNGFLLIWKELDKGLFSLSSKKDKQHLEINSEEFSWLIAGLPWEQMSQWGKHSFQQFS